MMRHDEAENEDVVLDIRGTGIEVSFAGKNIVKSDQDVDVDAGTDNCRL